MTEIASPSYHGSLLLPSLDRATVADAMHPGVVACSPEARLTDVARIMASHHVHCVVLLREGHDGSGEPYVWGIVSDLDLIRGGLNPGSVDSAAAVARQPTISVTPELPLRQAAGLMLRHRVSHVVVVAEDTRRPLGLLSTLDVAEILAWGEG